MMTFSLHTQHYKLRNQGAKGKEKIPSPKAKHNESGTYRLHFEICNLKTNKIQRIG